MSEPTASLGGRDSEVVSIPSINCLRVALVCLRRPLLGAGNVEEEVRVVGVVALCAVFSSNLVCIGGVDIGFSKTLYAEARNGDGWPSIWLPFTLEPRSQPKERKRKLTSQVHVAAYNFAGGARLVLLATA